jgi:hypothetical protein
MTRVRGIGFVRVELRMAAAVVLDPFLKVAVYNSILKRR